MPSIADAATSQHPFSARPACKPESHFARDNGPQSKRTSTGAMFRGRPVSSAAHAQGIDYDAMPTP